MKNIIQTDAYPILPELKQILCPAVRAGNLLFCSGVVGRDPRTLKIVTGGMEAQARQAFQNLGAALRAAGSSFDDVVHMVAYVKRKRDFKQYARVRGKIFRKPTASAAIFGVQLFDPKALIEIVAVAAIP